MIPKPLRVVALIQLVCGLSALAGMLFQLSNSRLNIEFGVLGIPIYFGLRRFSRGWRTCLLVLLWFDLLLTPVMFLMGLTTRAPAFFQFCGVRLADVSPHWVSVLCVPLFALALWQYRVLTRPSIRGLFLQPAGQRAA